MHFQCMKVWYSFRIFSDQKRIFKWIQINVFDYKNSLRFYYSSVPSIVFFLSSRCFLSFFDGAYKLVGQTYVCLTYRYVAPVGNENKSPLYAEREMEIGFGSFSAKKQKERKKDIEALKKKNTQHLPRKHSLFLK